MTNRLSTLAAACLALLAGAPAVAVENLTSDELQSHCVHYPADPDGADGIFCVRYVQGFIDGAVATDERVTRNVAAEYDDDESFTERAIRTRIGSRLERFGPSYFAEFCLGAPVPLATVVDIVVADLANDKLIAEYPLARDLVYQTLRNHYPCDTDPS